MSAIKFGWAEADITPDKKVSLDGQFAERISEYVEKPLTVTALAIECGGEQLILVSADLVSMPMHTVELVRARLADNEVGLDPMKIVISAIHTHCGPRMPGGNQSSKYLAAGGSLRDLLTDFLPEGRTYVEAAPITQNPDIATTAECAERFVSRTADAILRAWTGRKPGSFSNAFGRAAVGHCRRATYSDGSAQMWGDTNTACFVSLEGGSDSGVELLYVFDEQTQLTGVLVNLACPAQCVQHRLFVSPDFWGEVKVRLRQHFGNHIFLLPQCSAAGDQCPVDLIRWVQPESDVHDPNIIRNDPPKRKADPSMFDLAGMYKTGKRIAAEVIDVFEEGLDHPIADTVLEHRVETAALPLRRVTMREYHQAARNIREYLNEHPNNVNFNTAAQLQVYLGVIKRFRLQERMDVVNCEIHTARLGSIAFASNPFELFLNYGNQIKARSKAEQTFLIQLANGAEGYLPTEQAERGGHYSAFVGSGQVGHEGGDLLVRQTLSSINDMF